MEESKKIWIASWAFAKKLNYSELYYSDYMYGNEHLTEEVWNYVEELNDIGRTAFYEKYQNFVLYSY